MRAVLLYIGLLTSAVLVEFGLLHLGANLLPPVSVGGDWSIETGEQTANGPLRDLWSARNGPQRFTIKQSGPYLQLKFNNPAGTTLEGKVEGTVLVAQGTGITSGTDWERPVPDTTIVIKSHFQAQSRPTLLSGEITFSGSWATRTIPFTATRQFEAGKAGVGS